MKMKIPGPSKTEAQAPPVIAAADYWDRLLQQQRAAVFTPEQLAIIAARKTEDQESQ